MRSLQLAAPGERFKVLCFGAHSDDIEIGAGRNASELDRAWYSRLTFTGACSEWWW